VGQIHAETCKFNFYVWVRGDFNGLNISKVKVQGHGEIILRYLEFDIYARTLLNYGQIKGCLTVSALSSGHLSIMDIKLRCRFELVMFGLSNRSL
jgi:hypothetical protein